jgi:methionine-rich copper-binding protein CopC
MLRAAALALALVLAPFAAEAHAIIVASVPAPKALVPGPDIDVKLDFNSRIDKARSKLELVGPDKAEQRLPIAEEGAAGTLTTKATGLAPGAWRLRWQVLSVDGHITRGDIPFTVGPAP